MPDLVFIGVAIILVGFLVVLLAMIMAKRSAGDPERRTQVKGGGVILVGPIPIIFGSDTKWASVAIILAIVLMVIVLLSGVLLGR